ncbi:calmodulin-binding protein 60 D-like [Humulus lupulus]|uniref:calmodulin-binding protein 60 D-like n=1 Tax=Humulus lupulus TaxID=3486 RepID=UPI002B40C1FC|nr:calmodulin-binding protein 60 D-like [Humulus lupulus]
MALDTVWSSGPDGTQVHSQESGIRCSAVGRVVVGSSACQRRGGGVAITRTILNHQYLSGIGISVIVEALKVDSLQKLCSSLEPILRRVSEEVERALAKVGPPMLNGRSSPKRIEGPDGRNLQLHFRSRLSLPLFTGGKVEGEQGAAIHVVLVDGSTGQLVISGPEASVKLDVVVVEGDFNNEDEEGWTQEEFESHVVKEREGKRPLLHGDLQLTLKDGVGTLGDLIFTDNSSWIRSRKFRLGLKVASGFCEGIRIREAKTEAFTVKDHRGELYKKHYPPALNDEVWRLEKIGKDGSFHKRLTNFITLMFFKAVHQMPL